MNYNDIPLVNNKTEGNYEMIVDGRRSFIDYVLKGNKIYLVHTEVPAEQSGDGLAAVLVEKALRDIETQGLKLVPVCAYVQYYLKKYPEWNRLLDDKAKS